jgi:hypothetical protein
MNMATAERYTNLFTPSTTGSFGGTGSYIVSPGFETTHLLSTLFPVPIFEIGSNKFTEAYCINLERLSIQAHLTAGANNEVAVNIIGGGGESNSEYVVEACIEENKVESLVKTLLALEFWREHVLFRRSKADDTDGDEVKDEYSELNSVDGGEESGSVKQLQLADRLAENGNALRTAFILHAETTIVGMLNLIFYKGIPPELFSGGDEVLLALVDYCARQLVSYSSMQIHLIQLSHFIADLILSHLFLLIC